MNNRDSIFKASFTIAPPPQILKYKSQNILSKNPAQFFVDSNHQISNVLRKGKVTSSGKAVLKERTLF